MPTYSTLVEYDGKPCIRVPGGPDLDRPVLRFYYYPVKGRFTEANNYLIGHSVDCRGDHYLLQVGESWQPFDMADGRDTKWIHCEEVKIAPPGRGGKTWQWEWHNMMWSKRYRYNEGES